MRLRIRQKLSSLGLIFAIDAFCRADSCWQFQTEFAWPAPSTPQNSIRMITLYHCVSARSFRPLWMLEELQLPLNALMAP